VSSGGKVKEYNIIFKSSGADEYRPLKCDEFGVCTFSDGLLALKDQFNLKGGCQDDPNGVLTCVSKDFAGVTERCFVPSKLGQSCSMSARLEHFAPCDVSELGFGEAETTTDPPGGPGTVAAGPVSSPTTSPPSSPPVSGASPESGQPDSGETSNLVINGWWTDCNLPTEAEPDSCRGGSLVAPANGAILINFDSCYANPNFDPRGVSFYTVDGNGGAVIGFHLLFASDAAYSLLAPTDCNGGVCYCSLPRTLRDLRQEILDQGSCGGSIFDGVKCVSERIVSSREACYVPVLEDVSTPSGNKLYCAMAADIDFQVAGAASPSQDPGSSGLPEWAIALISLVILLIFFVLAVGFVRYRRTCEFFSTDDEEEEVWVTPRPHDYKFTRRALNTDDTGDGVWKQSNIHDLKFQMTL
jgi:hypothetical protein